MYIPVCVRSFAEGSVLLLFLTTVSLWITRKPDIFPGWSSLLGHSYVYYDYYNYNYYYYYYYFYCGVCENRSVCHFLSYLRLDLIFQK